VCLVDEIDLHLHPRWQRDLITRLTALFPNTQFIATAHSPLVVQAAPDANVVVLKRQGDSVIIDNAPRSVRKWRVDPQPYISFRQHVPIAVDGNARGEQTIDALGLRREELNQARERHLEVLLCLHKTATLPGVPTELQQEARSTLTKLVGPTTEYSLMCQVAIDSLGGMPSPA
jgi:hypothetical protein